MAFLTLLYVALSLLVDEGITGIASDVIVVLAVLFFAEFSLRFWDSPSRLRYLKDHWIDLLTCLPAIGPLRLLRLVRLLGLLRLAHEIREVATASSSTEDKPSPTWIVWTVLMIVMLRVFGRHHPPVMDEDAPLDRARLALAVVALVIFVLCFIPVPFPT